MEIMLFHWNRASWYWQNYQDFSVGKRLLPFKEKWVCKASNANKGDLFLLMLTEFGKAVGLIGFGKVISEPQIGSHWDRDKKDRAEKVRYVEAEFIHLVNLHEANPLPVKILKAKYSNFYWDTQYSGTKIDAKIWNELKNDWGIHINQKGYYKNELYLGGRQIKDSKFQKIIKTSKKTNEHKKKVKVEPISFDTSFIDEILDN